MWGIALQIAAIVGCLFLLTKFKLLATKVMLLAYLYPAVYLVALQLLKGEVLSLGLRSYANYLGLYFEYIDVAFWTLIAGYLAYVAGLWSSRSTSFFIARSFVLDRAASYGLYGALILSVIVAYPWVFGLTPHRVGFLPGEAWNGIYVAIYIILLLVVKAEQTILRSSLIFWPLLLVVSGERVDSILLLVCVLFIRPVMSGKTRSVAWKRASTVRTLLLGTVLSLGATYIGLLRGGETGWERIAISLISHETVRDVTHIYLSAFSYRESHGSDFRPLLNLVWSFIPFHPLGGGDSPISFTRILRQHVWNNGGGLYITEGYISFGMAGVLFYSWVLGVTQAQMLRARSFIGGALYLVAFALSLRLLWYGIEALIKPLMIVSLLVMVLFGAVKANNRSFGGLKQTKYAPASK